MIIYKPDWIAHTDDKSRKTSLFTLSINPLGTKLATGGLDPQIRIWSVKPILDEAIHADGLMSRKFSSSEPRLLSTLARHTGSVMCLRWSPKGNYLASCSDDTTVIIWALESHMQPSSRLSEILNENRNHAFETVSIEKYKVVQRLTLHQSDVTGLAWSPDQTQLASCGLDNMIYIWETAGFTCVHHISAHKGFVKGLAWDPVGHYLASHSDDSSMMIWRVKDWVMEYCSTEPFKHPSGATYFQRPSWTPTGSHLIAANASNGPLPIAALIERANWSTGLGLLGHAEPIEVAAFNPVVFRRPARKKENNGDIFETDNESDQVPDMPLIYCALGSQDRSVSLWRNHSSRPLVVVQDLFEHSVMDLCWSANGSYLFAASYDGSIAVIVFQTESELGLTCSAREKEKLLSKYGPTKDDIDLPTSVADYVARENEKAAKEREEQLSLIEPDLIATHAGHAYESSEMDSLITSEAVPISLSPKPDITAVPAPALTPIPMAAPAPAPQQVVTMTKDGKKRIQPQLLVGGASPVPDRTAKTAMPLHDDKRARRPFSKDKASSASSAPSHTGPIRIHEFPFASKVAKLPLKKEKFVHILKASEQDAIIDTGLLLVEVQDDVISLIRDSLVEWTAKLPFEDLRVVAGNRNYIICGGPCSQWSLDHTVLTTATEEEDETTETMMIGQVMFLSTESGRALCPPIYLDSPVCHLAASEGIGSFACALTLHGGLYLWNLTSLKNLTPVPTSNGLQRVLYAESRCMTLDPMSVKKPSKSARNPVSVLVSCTSLGGKKGNVPFIELSHGAKYIYHLDMNAWMRLESFPLSDYLSNEPVSKKDRLDQIKERMMEGSTMIPRRQASLCHIEHQLSLACILESAEDYFQWFRIYIKRACDEKAICKLLDILKQVFGPCSIQPAKGFGPGFLNSYFDNQVLMSDDSSNDASFVSHQLGISKSRFAKEALPLLKGFSSDDPRILSWQSYLDSFKI